MKITLTREQSALAVAEAIKQASRDCDCTPREAFRPLVNNRAAVAARNIAIRLAFNSGVHPKDLCEAFGRGRDTVDNALKATA